MLTTVRLKSLTLQYDPSSASAPVILHALNALDACHHLQRPNLDFEADTEVLIKSGRLSQAMTSFERCLEFARASGDDNEWLRMAGPDAKRCTPEQYAIYRGAIDANMAPPVEVPLAHVWIRRGDLRRFVMMESIRRIHQALTDVSDHSPQRLKRLSMMLKDVSAKEPIEQGTPSAWFGATR